jgi:hypothetical protein
MLYRRESTFEPFYMCCFNFSQHKSLLVQYMPAVKLLSLKWTQHRGELLNTLYRRNEYLKTRQILPSHSSLQLTVEHKPERTDR